MSDFDISAEEMKLWQEKQQKRDKLSRIMGEYLLKGYRMLDSYCPVCNVRSAALLLFILRDQYGYPTPAFTYDEFRTSPSPRLSLSQAGLSQGRAPRLRWQVP